MANLAITIHTSYRDYLALCKLPVVALMLITSLVGMQLATPALLNWQPVVFACLGIGCVASASAGFNHFLDYQLDRLMQRTQQRPLPAGKILPKQAFLFSMGLGIVGSGILVIWINVLTALLALFSLLGYSLVYTAFLKRNTPQNIVIGGLAGATPPLLGWTAITNHIDPNSLVLVLIIFIWTPPHFWSLAIHRYQDYQKANIPMLPITHGVKLTAFSILLYTVLLSVVSLLPFITGLSGVFYLAVNLILNTGFLYWAIVLFVHQSQKIALQTFHYSNFYLLILFFALLIDHYLTWSV